MPVLDKDDESIERDFEKSYALRTNFWSGIGKLDSDIFAPMLNPRFMGGPRWPRLREAFITVRRTGSTIIASDGLSDPFDRPGDEETRACNGFGLELYIESVGDLAPVIGSWQMHIIYSMSHQASCRCGKLNHNTERV